MYELIYLQDGTDRPWLILRPDGTIVFALVENDEAHARVILENLNYR